MIRQLTNLGTGRGIVLDKAILDQLGIQDDAAFEITVKNGGLFLKPLDFKAIYEDVSERHRKSLDKLGE
jgi:antitoxin component of MazEF toxin-antitoxin module